MQSIWSARKPCRLPATLLRKTVVEDVGLAAGPLRDAPGGTLRPPLYHQASPPTGLFPRSSVRCTRFCLSIRVPWGKYQVNCRRKFMLAHLRRELSVCLGVSNIHIYGFFLTLQIDENWRCKIKKWWLYSHIIYGPFNVLISATRQLWQRELLVDHTWHVKGTRLLIQSLLTYLYLSIRF